MSERLVIRDRQHLEEMTLDVVRAYIGSSLNAGFEGRNAAVALLRDLVSADFSGLYEGGTAESWEERWEKMDTRDTGLIPLPEGRAVMFRVFGSHKEAVAFACSTAIPVEGGTELPKEEALEIESLTECDLIGRGLHAPTCRSWNRDLDMPAIARLMTFAEFDEETAIECWKQLDMRGRDGWRLLAENRSYTETTGA